MKLPTGFSFNIPSFKNIIKYLAFYMVVLINNSKMCKGWIRRIIMFGICSTILAKVAATVENTHQSESSLLSPQFLGPIVSYPLRLTIGDNVTLVCRIENLGNYMISWLYVDKNAVLTNQTEIITTNGRIGLRHESVGNLSSWHLIIHNISLQDAGYYACQIKTLSPKILLKFLDIIIPPKFDEDSLKSGTILSVKEFENVSIPCKANGNPKPKIKWKKEQGRILLNSNSTNQEERETVESDVLSLGEVSRWASGNYICTALTEIAPPISRRIIVDVQFPPMIIIPNQAISATFRSNVTLECIIESNPTAQHVWIDAQGNKIKYNHDGKYSVISKRANKFKVYFQLVIKNVNYRDSGKYVCVAQNDLGETKSKITLTITDKVITTTQSILSLNDLFVMSSNDKPKKQLKIAYQNNEKQNENMMRNSASIPLSLQLPFTLFLFSTYYLTSR